jgi:DNA repair photolyase
MGRRNHPGEVWGSFVDVKINAIECLSRELSKKKRGCVLLSSVTDPYQPLELKWRLTRNVLQLLLDYDFPTSIQTKSPLVLRDLDLLKKFTDIEVGFTIISLDDEFIRIFEPNTPSIEKRLEALDKLDEAGINTYAFLGPMLPFFSNDNIETLLVELASSGVDKILVDRLNIKAGNWPPLKRAIEENYPSLFSSFSSVARSKHSEYYEELRLNVTLLAQSLSIPIYFCY